MLEWYRVDERYEAVMQDCVAILRLAATGAGAGVLRYRNRDCDPFAEPERMSVAQAFKRYAGIDLLATVLRDGSTDAEALAAQLRATGITVPDAYTWSYLFSLVLTEKVEANLGLGRVTILDEYPAAEAALAQKSERDARVAERFEVYACGVELANGFGELTDAHEQRRRFAAEMTEKLRLYGETYPLDEDFLAALAIMPDASGIAMGFDRVVMLATGAPRIDAVLWAPVVG